MRDNKLFEIDETTCPICGAKIDRELFSEPGVSEFWCDDCNIKITIDDKNRDELNTELSSVDLFELNTMRMEEARFLRNTHYVTTTGESIVYPETPLILQAFNNTDADLTPKSISRSDAEKILTKATVDEFLSLGRRAEVTPEIEISKSAQEVLSSKWNYDEQKRDSDER